MGDEGEIKDHPFKELELNERIRTCTLRLFRGAQSKSVLYTTYESNTCFVFLLPCILYVKSRLYKPR